MRSTVEGKIKLEFGDLKHGMSIEENSDGELVIAICCTAKSHFLTSLYILEDNELEELRQWLDIVLTERKGDGK
jgi:hypothetical protein